MSRRALIFVLLAVGLLSTLPGALASTDGQPTLSATEMPVAAVEEPAVSADEDAGKVELAELFAAEVQAVCIDSGIPCSSSRECRIVCGSLPCVCAGTCVYCP